MKTMKLKQRLKTERLFGYWSVLPLLQLHEIFGDAGMQFSIIDLEHGSQSFQDAIESMIAIEKQGMYSLIRPSSHDEKEILRCLETGAEGICVPHIRTVDEAQKIISACLYPPAGIRGASGFTRATSYGRKEFKMHTEQANEDLFICLLIESIEGLSNLQDICKIERIDCIYFGTYDIASSANIADQNSDEVQKLISDAIKTVSREDIIFGQVAVNAQQVNTLDERITFVPFGVDCGLMQRGVEEILKETGTGV